MKKTPHPIKWLANVSLIVAALFWAASSQASELINFGFNEGSGISVTDSASGYVGRLGSQQDTNVDYAQLTPNSPSGNPGDGSVTFFGGGFLVVDDSTNAVLDITNGPITMEAWAYLPPVSSNIQGIASYGGSYKLGLKGGFLVFTLYGQKDITNLDGGFVFDSEWNHLVAAWNPGVGVDFYINGVHNFVEYTNTSAARPVSSHYLSLGAETSGNNFAGSLDRVRIHHAHLEATDLDSDALNPKAPLTSTVVSYNFNESSFPSTNAIAPPLPTFSSSILLANVSAPSWTNDTPSGLPGDFALSFDLNQPIREVINVDTTGNPINLGANGTNYTLQVWVKMPTAPLEERRVIYQTSGTGPRITLSVNSDRTLHTTILAVQDITSSVAIPNDNHWHHIAVVMRDYANVDFYLDGALRQTAARTDARVATSSGAELLRIGKESETRYFYGIMDRVIINNDALTASQLDFPAVPGLPTFPTFAAQPADLALPFGSDATFTAAPESSTPATYQWYFRTNLGAEKTLIPGETTTTLIVTNIDEADLGYYSITVSNDVGFVESYDARLSLPIDLSPKLFDFETPTYLSGVLDEQDGWQCNDNSASCQVLTASEITNFLDSITNITDNPVHSGSQALVFSGPGVAANAYRYFTGLETETDVTMDVWVRALEGSPNGNVFVPLENSSGTRAAAFRIGPAYSIDYGLVGGAWVPSGLVANPGEWHHIKIHANYSTKTYDFFVDDVQVNTNPIPFYTSTANRLDRVHLFKGAGQIGMILDDLNISTPSAAPQLGIRTTSNGLTLFWPSSASGYVLEGTGALPATTWNSVSYTTVGNENQATITPGTGNQFYRLRK
jgi:hypothetical protein